jgi:hypothetical protein
VELPIRSLARIAHMPYSSALLRGFFASHTYTTTTTTITTQLTKAHFATMARTFFVGGNWKMNGSLESTKQLTQTLTQAKLDSNVGKCAGRRFKLFRTDN